jgi:hypothetical protein
MNQYGAWLFRLGWLLQLLLLLLQLRTSFCAERDLSDAAVRWFLQLHQLRAQLTAWLVIADVKQHIIEHLATAAYAPPGLLPAALYQHMASIDV